MLLKLPKTVSATLSVFCHVRGRNIILHPGMSSCSVFRCDKYPSILAKYIKTKSTANWNVLSRYSLSLILRSSPQANNPVTSDHPEIIGALTIMLPSAKNLRINITKNVIKNVTHCFILNGKELSIHYSTTADVFLEVFCDVYLRSFKVYILVGGM